MNEKTRADQVLIIGGMGRIGRAVAQDLLIHSEACITLTGRRQRKNVQLHLREKFAALDLNDEGAMRALIKSHDLVIHCAGAFRDRNHQVLLACIDLKVPYLDVADSPDYVDAALKFNPVAKERGVLAVVSTGVFPGISCSMAKQGIESLDQANELKLGYLVAGSGGAGVTVMRTTFLELQTPFRAQQQGKTTWIKPYSEREVLTFPEFGKGGVYWFNTVEALTLVRSFPDVASITTKFGSMPDLYNYLTWLVAQAPSKWLKNSRLVEFLSQVSYGMTQISDRFSGVGIAMRCDITGKKDGARVNYHANFFAEDTATCAGQGAGIVAVAMMTGNIQGSGVLPVEQALPTELFGQSMKARSLDISSTISPEYPC